ncbi:sperm-associated antigen 4 protein-like isoform X2 [Pezoporus occidentalis]|uniref:sperm-associated antigen 4 protein-like isoform X2 n=1 Tax=Pezoporus occidentalis TaxID=407982 RepID=UPI002F917D64
MLALSRKKMDNMQHLRDELASLAAEINTAKKEAQQLREGMSAITQMSGWAVKSTRAAINLQRSSSSSAWLCRMFWFLRIPPILDTFVQPDSSPGYCWPFQGSESEVLIQLPAKVRPTAITVQHTLKTDSPLRTISSAPRNFIVYGLNEGGEDETPLGTFTYTAQEEVIQTFPLQVQCSRIFPRTHFLGPSSLRFPEPPALLSEAWLLICRGAGVLWCEGGRGEEGRSCHLSQCRSWSWSQTWLAEEDGRSLLSLPTPQE